jgi:hypothetical protein
VSDESGFQEADRVGFISGGGQSEERRRSSGRKAGQYALRESRELPSRKRQPYGLAYQHEGVVGDQSKGCGDKKGGVEGFDRCIIEVGDDGFPSAAVVAFE